MDQTPAEGFASLVDVLLESITPDEARILSALSDGSRYPVVQIGTAGIGVPQRRVLSNASSVGRAAGVALPDRTPEYLTHMQQLGLVELGPEDTGRTDEYEILLTDATVRRARLEIDQSGRGRMKVTRQTVRISDLGRQLWDVVRPGDT